MQAMRGCLGIMKVAFESHSSSGTTGAILTIKDEIQPHQKSARLLLGSGLFDVTTGSMFINIQTPTHPTNYITSGFLLSVFVLLWSGYVKCTRKW